MLCSPDRPKFPAGSRALHHRHHHQERHHPSNMDTHQARPIRRQPSTTNGQRCSTWNTHPGQNKGRLAGTPSRRGYSSEQSATNSSTCITGDVTVRNRG